MALPGGASWSAAVTRPVADLHDDAFARLAASRARLVVTSGNHDSAHRLGFGSRLIDAAGVFIRTDAATSGVPA